MTFHLAAAPAKVCGVMREPAVIDESQRLNGAMEVEVTSLTATDDVHEFEIVVVSPSHGLMGINPDKTEESRTRVRWDLAALQGIWSWSGVHGRWVEISGTYGLTADGDGSALELKTDITVPVPILGALLERKIKTEIERGLPPYVEVVRKHLERSLP